MKYYLAFAADGTVFKRSTQNRSYSHCVAAYTRSPARQYGDQHWEACEGWGKGQWAGRRDLAEKAASQERNMNRSYSKTEVVRVEILDAFLVSAAEFKSGKLGPENQRVLDIKQGRIKDGPAELARLFERQHNR
jgi:hypothetical protein